MFKEPGSLSHVWRDELWRLISDIYYIFSYFVATCICKSFDFLHGRICFIVPQWGNCSVVCWVSDCFLLHVDSRLMNKSEIMLLNVIDHFNGNVFWQVECEQHATQMFQGVKTHRRVMYKAQQDDLPTSTCPHLCVNLSRRLMRTSNWGINAWWRLGFSTHLTLFWSLSLSRIQPASLYKWEKLPECSNKSTQGKWNQPVQTKMRSEVSFPRWGVPAGFESVMSQGKLSGM